MALESGQADFVPTLPLAMRHHADVEVLIFQYRPLLDMQLERGVDREAADRFRSGKADALQLIAKRLALRVHARIAEFLGVDAREHTGRHHGGGEARAFLVGPVGDHDRPPRLDLEIVERAHHLQRAQNAEYAVELAAGRLGVEMAAHQDRREVILNAGPSGEHVAHLVDFDRAAFLFAPSAKQFAALLVEVGEGEALASALGRGADLGHLHQRVPQALSIDAHVRQVGQIFSPVALMGATLTRI